MATMTHHEGRGENRRVVTRRADDSAIEMGAPLVRDTAAMRLSWPGVGRRLHRDRRRVPLALLDWQSEFPRSISFHRAKVHSIGASLWAAVSLLAAATSEVASTRIRQSSIEPWWALFLRVGFCAFDDDLAPALELELVAVIKLRRSGATKRSAAAGRGPDLSSGSVDPIVGRLKIRRRPERSRP
jgi:hypothetical protein